MRKGGYYVNNTLLGEVDKWTGRRVNKLIVKKDRVTRGRVDKWTSRQVACGEYETTWELGFRYTAKSITSHKEQRLSDLGPYHVFSLV